LTFLSQPIAYSYRIIDQVDDAEVIIAAGIQGERDWAV
jgi:hypothetical protein